jgi:hypothetical protein
MKKPPSGDFFISGADRSRPSSLIILIQLSGRGSRARHHRTLRVLHRKVWIIVRAIARAGILGDSPGMSLIESRDPGLRKPFDSDLRPFMQEAILSDGFLLFRRRSESNRFMKVLQTSPFPLGYCAIRDSEYYNLYLTLPDPTGPDCAMCGSTYLNPFLAQQASKRLVAPFA